MTKQEFVQAALDGKRPFMPQELTTLEKMEWTTAVTEAQKAKYPKVKRAKKVAPPKPKYPVLIERYEKAKKMETHLLRWGSDGAGAWMQKTANGRQWLVDNHPAPFDRKGDAIAYIENLPKAMYLGIYVQYDGIMEGGIILEGVDLEVYEYCKRRSGY